MTIDDLQTEAETQDRRDSLAIYRNLFHIPQHHGQDAIYLCGNSLGLAPQRAVDDVHRELAAWCELGVEGHFKADRPWVSFHELFTNHLAKIVGAKASEVVAMNTLTVNLHLMLASFYQPTTTKFKILTGYAAFPSDRYALTSAAAMKGFDDALVIVSPRDHESTLRTSDIIAAMEDHRDSLALVLMDGVNYYTGEFLDIPALTAAAHRHGLLAGFDLAHAAGNVPMQLHDWNVDFAVWCSYKYLNGGPGCPAGCFVHERHGLNPKTPRLAGWWGHDKATRFAMGSEFSPIPGAEGWQLSNPPLFSLAALHASLELFSEISMPKLRLKSERLTGFLADGLSEIFADDIEILTPADPARRGCQLSLRLKRNAKPTFARLQSRGVICDWREPDVIRVAPVPLYNRFQDVAAFLSILHEILPRHA